MGFIFLPWEKLPPRYRGLPFMILGILVSINTFSETPVHLGYLVSGLALIATGPIVFLGIRSEEKAKMDSAKD